MNEMRQTWQALDYAHHIHPFTDPKALKDKGPTVITRADGAYIWDADGNKILDGMAGLWCVNVGYGQQALVDAATEQLRQLPYYNTFFQTVAPPQVELADTLSKITPDGLDHFFFANSGSEANDTIIRLARHFWNRQGKPEKMTFIGRENGYHGSTLAAVSLGGMKHMHDMEVSLLPGFEHIMQPHWYTGSNPGESPEDFGLRAARALEEKILEIGPEKVAAFIGEPVQGAGGVIDPPASYWPEIQRICRQYDVLLVADEVICGFGRTGEWFGSQTYGIEPDLMPMAKGLSSGYAPISAVAISERVYKGIEEGGLLSHGFTYSGHPVSCAVALANIRLMQELNLVDRVREDIAPYFRQCLGELADSHPMIGEFRGVGLLAGLQLVKDRETREIFTAQDNAANLCRDRCLANGLVMRAVGQTLVASPPLTLTRDQVDELVGKLNPALDETAREFGLL